jgi:hypothetical protein
VADLLLKAHIILLGEGNVPGWQIPDAEDALLQALQISPGNAKVLLEIGYFYSRIMDEPNKAVSYFQRVLYESVSEYQSGLLGMVECVVETSSQATAVEIINKELLSLKESVQAELPFPLYGKLCVRHEESRDEHE